MIYFLSTVSFSQPSGESTRDGNLPSYLAALRHIAMGDFHNMRYDKCGRRSVSYTRYAQLSRVTGGETSFARVANLAYNERYGLVLYHPFPARPETRAFADFGHM